METPNEEYNLYAIKTPASKKLPLRTTLAGKRLVKRNHTRISRIVLHQPGHYTLSFNNENLMPTVSIAMLRSSSGQECKSTMSTWLEFLNSQLAGGRVDALVGVLDACLKVGVGLLTAGGVVAGGWGVHSAGAVGARRQVTPGSGRLALGLCVRGGRSLCLFSAFLMGPQP